MRLFWRAHLRPSMPGSVPDGQTRVVRIVEQPPTSGLGSYWYVLEVVDGPYPPGTRLRNAFAKRRANPQDAALAKLMAWARTNG
jgi:hypothetical protein